ncbi:MAG: hypothetical protein EOP45_07695, partial [Sphingobacteriaceae bacterium]
MIFDAEQYNGVYFIFDSIVTTTNYDMYEYTLEERKWIIKEFVTDVNIPEFQTKPYYSDINLLTIQIALEPDKQKYDGIIFAPKAIRKFDKCCTTNTLIWKQTTTFDLLYLWNESKDRGQQKDVGDLWMESSDLMNPISLLNYQNPRLKLPSIHNRLKSISQILQLHPLDIICQDSSLHGLIIQVKWNSHEKR